MKKKLGKIENVWFGHGGYQDACIGINFTLSFDGGGTQTGETAWDANMIKCTEHCKWTEADRSRQYDEIMRYISDLLHQAKVKNIADLKDVPIEATIEGNALKEWRILTEVI